MAHRINISIPDELHAELEKWREQLNVSGICQDALRKEVARLEAVATGSGDIDSVVERLRGEKDEWERQWYERGIQLGHEWARSAPYQRFLEWQSPERRPPDDVVRLLLDPVDQAQWRVLKRIRARAAPPLLAMYPTLRHIFSERLDDPSFVQARDHNSQALSAGWLKGVRDFWNQVKDAL